jgi:hypothetical protein
MSAINTTFPDLPAPRGILADDAKDATAVVRIAHTAGSIRSSDSRYSMYGVACIPTPDPSWAAVLATDGRAASITFGPVVHGRLDRPIKIDPEVIPSAAQHRRGDNAVAIMPDGSQRAVRRDGRESQPVYGRPNHSQLPPIRDVLPKPEPGNELPKHYKQGVAITLNADRLAAVARAISGSNPKDDRTVTILIPDHGGRPTIVVGSAGIGLVMVDRLTPEQVASTMTTYATAVNAITESRTS